MAFLNNVRRVKQATAVTLHAQEAALLVVLSVRSLPLTATVLLSSARRRTLAPMPTTATAIQTRNVRDIEVNRVP